MPRLLVVEDEVKLLDSLQRGLQEEGYEVVSATSGEEGYQCATTQPLDAIVIDRMLPRRDGLDVVRSLRKEGFTKPILILTARDSLEDRVDGLDSGADDYLVKPFAFAELLARMRAALRRDRAGGELVLRAEDLEMDLVGRRVTRAGEELDLTRREFDLLEYLLRNKNTPVTRDMVARNVWKESAGTLTNVIDVYINLLRKKIERPHLLQLIHTIRGVGYVLKEGS